MNSKNSHAPDISYFRLSLTDFLRESHPERLNDERFILASTNAGDGFIINNNFHMENLLFNPLVKVVA